MKIYLDDVRPTPEGWIPARWPKNVIDLLEQGGVEEISLDHDLGDDMRTGYAVLTWIEEAVITRGFVPPKIRIHTANISARQKMEAAVESIKRRTLQ